MSPDRIEPAQRQQIVDGIVAFLPNLRAFAIKFTRDTVRAEDAVQQTVLVALDKLDLFEPGTNLHAWLFTIMRNLYHTAWRRLKREVEDTRGVLSGVDVGRPGEDVEWWYGNLATGGERDAVARLDYVRLQGLLDQLPVDQREVLVLVCINGMSYEDAADVLGCAVGTVKSRLNRARAHLAGLMGEYELKFLSEEEEAWAVLTRSGALDDYEEGMLGA